MNVIGAIDLRLIGGLVENLNARGAAKINVSIEGTVSAPRINGTTPEGTQTSVIFIRSASMAGSDKMQSPIPPGRMMSRRDGNC